MIDSLFPILSGIVLGALITGIIVYLWMKKQISAREGSFRIEAVKSESKIETHERDIDNLGNRLQETREQAAQTEQKLQQALVSEASLKTSLSEQKKQNEEKLGLLQETRESMNNEFKALANQIFESKHKVFKAESKEQLDNILSPLSERIKEFEKRVEKSYNDESKERYSLIKEVRNLQDLNTRISKDAINLTNALKGESKTQGTWGEIILERVLEKSGLEKGREYEVQVSMKNEDGRRLQPDVIVHLPEEKDVVIDAKVSLTAYERYCSTDDDQDRAESLKQHLQSMRQHIKQLGDKDYHNLEGLKTLDFVLLFVPIEAAFSLAVQQDNNLFTDAFERNIVMVAPSTLLATLRTIQNIWRYEQQNKNAQEIASKAGALYDKFVNFVADLENIGAKIDSTQAAYRDAHNKLTSGRGNLVRRAEGMRELGAKVSKSLPQKLIEITDDDSESK
jgi:DNA recombination protein RmuC